MKIPPRIPHRVEASLLHATGKPRHVSELKKDIQSSIMGNDNFTNVFQL
jgi:hypothetical protein